MLNLGFLKICNLVVVGMEVSTLILDIVEMLAGLFEGFGKLGGASVSRSLQGGL
jgi:hypothetical protein